MKLRHRACGKVASTFTRTTDGIRVESARTVFHDTAGHPIAGTYEPGDEHTMTYPSPVDHYFDLLEVDDNLEVECLRCYPPVTLSIPWKLIHEAMQRRDGVLKWPPST